MKVKAVDGIDAKLTNRPVTEREIKMLERLRKHGIIPDLNKIWEEGPSNRLATDLAHDIGAIDWLFGGDSLGLDFGGDGDNGETLIFILQVVLDLWQKEFTI